MNADLTMNSIWSGIKIFFLQIEHDSKQRLLEELFAFILT